VARVTPWHSAVLGVYHDNTACGEGQSISLQHLRAGTGQRPLCAICAQFDEDEAKQDSIDTVNAESANNL